MVVRETPFLFLDDETSSPAFLRRFAPGSSTSPQSETAKSSVAISPLVVVPYPSSQFYNWKQAACVRGRVVCATRSRPNPRAGPATSNLTRILIWSSFVARTGFKACGLSLPFGWHSTALLFMSPSVQGLREVGCCLCVAWRQHLGLQHFRRTARDTIILTTSSSHR